MNLKPILKVYTGTMFAGKTDALISALNRYIIAKQNVMLFKPQVDTRYSANEVKTHDGVGMNAVSIEKIEDIVEYVDKYRPDVVGIDEIQFFESNMTIEIIDKLLWAGYPVLVAGLDMDYKARPFGAMPYLMAKAEEVIKFKAVCTDCGEDSSFEYRKDSNDSNLVKLGGSDAYDSLCRSCLKERIMQSYLKED